jgi:glutaredoxin
MSGRIVSAVMAALLLSACRRGPAEAAPKAEATGPEPARIDVRADRKDLVYSYLDPSGRYHDATSVDEVPEASRAQVLVRDLSKSPDELHAADYLYVADLRQPDAVGRYTCGAVSRFSFDRTGAREAAGETAAAAVERGEQLVTVYSTTWCGVCKQAKKWLKSKGIPFVERDVEKDAGASDELSKKATRAGVRPGGVPVIDVAGELMLGFDPGALERLLTKKGLDHPL